MPLHRNRPEGGDLCAIFVHAGAGFHSFSNEKTHLSAVNDAARVAMAILKNGGDAVDAVEMAIRLLEDREITNAGYGSNLTEDGHVECDATIVDHLGRSGAAGCVSQIKNPIALARIILDASSQPLSLQRVPPNLLVGPGATEFAAEQGLPILPHDYLISENARNRWISWKHDLSEVAEKEKTHHKSKNRKFKKHSQANRATTSIAISPPATPEDIDNKASDLSALLPGKESSYALETDLQIQQYELGSSNISKHAVEPTSFPQYTRLSETWSNGNFCPGVTNDGRLGELASPMKRQRLDGSMDMTELSDELSESTDMERDDYVTDTVGAIAVDCFGNVAAGSSSGGIGMKRRGRCGPAALVGIGTAVIPVDKDDPEKTCVATVTSGTGEHMATTLAASTAADRIYHCTRKVGAGTEPCDEDEALNSMIRKDFMMHPGVQDQPCVGAIGVLSVKKTKDGVYFYFGHNTDSFALASMHSEERKPVCTMSRSKGHGSVAQGGRVARTRRARI